ncbi:MAG TPA: hypothetical protein VEW68_10590, partial [Patescibacteria group bacterium]|nr:hypothetical protein [Patescibacteria group bacterium]
GTSFTGTTANVRTMALAGNQKTLADEFWQWTGITAGGAVVVGYYDRQYGNDDVVGASDYSVAYRGHSSRISNVSSPAPTEFGGLFLGDYNVLSVVGYRAWVTWTDDRNPGLTSCSGDVNAICTLGQDEDVFASRVSFD